MRVNTVITVSARPGSQCFLWPMNRLLVVTTGGRHCHLSPLRRRRPRHRQGEWLAQEHTARGTAMAGWGWTLRPGTSRLLATWGAVPNAPRPPHPGQQPRQRQDHGRRCRLQQHVPERNHDSPVNQQPPRSVCIGQGSSDSLALAVRTRGPGETALRSPSPSTLPGRCDYTPRLTSTPFRK